MSGPFTPAELHAMDLAQERRAVRAWFEDSKPVPLPLPEDDPHVDPPPSLQHWVAWVTLKGDMPVRLALGFQQDEDAALEAAHQVAMLQYPGRIVSIRVIARPA